jgi:hypothetical protein
MSSIFACKTPKEKIRFERLPELLALPVARGGYTDLIPRQVLAVLRTKVAALSGT